MTILRYNTLSADRVEFELHFTRPGVYLTFNEVDLAVKKDEKKEPESLSGPGATYEETKAKKTEGVLHYMFLYPFVIILLLYYFVVNL